MGLNKDRVPRRGARPRMAATVVTLALATLSPCLGGVTSAHSAAAATPGVRVGLGSNLDGLLRARRDTRRFKQIALNAEAVWQGGLLQVQVHLRPGVAPAAVTDASLAALGGRAGVRAMTVMNAWLPLDRVRAFARAERAHVAFVQLPWRPHILGDGSAGQGAGPSVSQGVAHMVADPAAFSCVNNTGAGVKVAVIDGGFAKLPASIKSGEAPHVEGKYVLTGGPHGTMCVEVVADVAPGATIRAISANSYAVLQQFQAEMKMGNPNKIDIVSHSVIWLGMSFGRDEGLACAVTKAARAQGVAWVNASGNSGAGQFHKGVWRDDDEDKRHEFSPKNPTLKFRQWWNGGTIKVALDWDDYAQRKTDIDLFLFRENEGGFLEQVAMSNQKQGPYTPPLEQIIVKKAPKGVYALVMVAKKTVPKGMAYRIVNLGSGASSFSIWHKNGNVYDPASCAGVLTVGAIHYSRYEKGPQEMYSSYGPTPDGRMKPEVMAPTGVKTSLGSFSGTSAACPHAAGALALYKAATSVSAAAIVSRFIADAEPMGQSDPNDVFGNGRVMLRAEGIGWQCAPADGATAPCATACGTIGTAACSATCALAVCEPPAEFCDAVDDDCDGETDEGCPTVTEGDADGAGADTANGDAEATTGTDDGARAVSGDADIVSDSATPPAGGRKSPSAGGCSATRPDRAPPDGHATALLLIALSLVTRRRCRGAGVVSSSPGSRS